MRGLASRVSRQKKKMNDYKKYAAFQGKLVFIGFGCIGQGVLPLVLRHIDIQPRQITLITADQNGADIARQSGVEFIIAPLQPGNHISILDKHIGAGDFILNLSVNVSSVALIEYCQRRRLLYLDTSIEPWAGGYTDPNVDPALRSNYALRESALALRAKFPGGPTAVLTHGANPGLVSHLVKQAMLNIAADTGLAIQPPRSREAWASLAITLGVKVIHISERDTQHSAVNKIPGEFVNTWSIEGFIGEGSQPAELGWGSHEKHWPADAKRYAFGSGAAIYLNRPGAATRVRSWAPVAGPFHGFLITHGESISIADYLSVKDNTGLVYRPTVHYAYHPCDDAVASLHELAGRNWRMQPKKRLLKEDIIAGMDELGVLLMGHKKGAYWYGSQLSNDTARQLAPHNSATSLQVTASVMAAAVWAMQHPHAGIVEPDEIEHEQIMQMTLPYLGKVVGVYSDWTPLQDRNWLFPEDIDSTDPWQFKNFRVM